MAFSVQPGVAIPPSLGNIFKEIKADLSLTSVRTHGDLQRWAEQGVLLLNACLTVRQGRANSHKAIGWREFLEEVLDVLIKTEGPLVVMLWGRFAQGLGADFRLRSAPTLILSSPHPSPLARGFAGNHHFSKCNRFLTDNGLEEVDWS